MLSDEVAAGEGALPTWMTREDSWIRKSSTSLPSGVTAWARIDSGTAAR